MSLSIGCLLTVLELKAQQHHQNAWMRATLSYPVSPKLKIDGEFQHRRQSGFESKDCLDEELMYTLRSWVHYQHNESVKFSVSPAAYFSHHRIIQQKADLSSDPVKEMRFSAAVDLQHEVFRKFFLTDRNAIEYRVFQGSASNITRTRNRFGIRYDFMPWLKAGIYEEFFVNLSGTTTYYFFDHKRNVVFLDYTPMPGLRIETGYAYIVRLPPGNLKKIKENNLFLNLTFQLHRHHGQSKKHSHL